MFYSEYLEKNKHLKRKHLKKKQKRNQPGDSAMSAEEKSRHEALVERCCEETPTGDKMRALFSHAPLKVLADHLDTLVNNGTVCALGVVYLRYS